MARAEVVPIGAGDLRGVGEFLQLNLNQRLTAADWASAIRAPWSIDAPNHGFMLVADGAIVGVYLAFYSTRQIDGRTERFCNLGAWCVLPTHRLHSLLLLRALLGQKGYHFTDLSPSGNTLSLNERLKFEYLDTTTALLVNLPWPLWSGGIRVTSEAGEVERALDAREQAIYRDHLGARAARHVVLLDGDAHCYVIFRKDRRKRLPLFASVLYVSNPSLFLKATRQFGRHLLLRHGIMATLMELRVIGGRPDGSHPLRHARRKMFRSDTLRPEQIDYLYSELVCVAW